MSQALIDRVLQYVLNQVQAGEEGLGLPPYADWRERVVQSVISIVPDIVRFAPDLMREVQLTLNSPRMIRESWGKIASILARYETSEEVKEEASTITSELERESHLLAEVTGETVSSLISSFLSRVRPDIASNNRSTYPDMYFRWADYSMLPQRTRSNPSGPALKRDKPTSVPDGLEIKSQRGRYIRVDCHHPHQGMHLVVTFDRIENNWEVYNVYMAYLSSADYRRATRNTTATTEKFSFGQTPFISVIDMPPIPLNLLD